MGWYCARCGTRADAPGACPRDRSRLAEAEAALGRAAGNYTLVARIGSGGMGEVFRAINPAIEAEVAIKVLHANATAGTDAARFLIEARAVNRVKHDGVAKILDAGYLETGRPYLVMELLDGESLADLLERTRVDLASALRIIDDVLGVVAAAHAAEIVHRDLKPANVFLTRSGRTVVLDFGVAKLLDSSATLTRTGAMIGTPAYMAPEQIQAHPIDGRADVYTVGVMLYELLAGTRPFAGTSFEVVTDHIQRPPPPLPAELPPALHQVVDRALAKAPHDRFKNALAMRQALAAAGNFAPSHSRPLAARRSGKVWLLVAGGLLAACAAVVTIMLLRDGGTGSPAVEDAAVVASTDDAGVADVELDAMTEVATELASDAAPELASDAAPDVAPEIPAGAAARVPSDAAKAPAVDATPPSATRAVAKKPATKTADDVNKLVADIKQLMADRSLITIDIPKSYRQPFEDARQSADVELMHERAVVLLAAVKKLVVDEKLVTAKLGHIKQVLDLRKPDAEATQVELATAQLSQAAQLVVGKRISDANRVLTAIYNEIAKWPRSPARPKPDDDAWK